MWELPFFAPETYSIKLSLAHKRINVVCGFHKYKYIKLLAYQAVHIYADFKIIRDIFTKENKKEKLKSVTNHWKSKPNITQY